MSSSDTASLLKNEAAVGCPESVDIHTKLFEKGIYKVTDGVYVAIGYALANCICVETEKSLVIIDVLEDMTTARILCKEFKKLCGNKPVSNIIITHGHADHFQGIFGFTENESIDPKVYFHEACIDSWELNTMFRGGSYPRAYRQFGTLLSHHLAHRKNKKWFKNNGIGPFLNVGTVMDQQGESGQSVFQDSFVDLTKQNIITFGKEGYTLKCDNLTFEMVEAFGESDDQIFITVLFFFSLFFVFCISVCVSLFFFSFFLFLC